MSAINQAVQVVQNAYGAFGRGDIPAVLDLIAHDVEWTFRGSEGLPYTGTFRTREAISHWFESIPKVDEILAFEPKEFISAGDHVTVLGWERTKARPSGKIFEAEWVHIFRVHEGRIVRFWGMYDTEASAVARE